MNDPCHQPYCLLKFQNRYNLPLLNPATCVEDLLRESNADGDDELREEVSASANSLEEGGVDTSKVPPELIARVIRRSLSSPICQRQGYIMLMSSFPCSENVANVIFSDEPKKVEKSNDVEEEEVADKKKGKKDDKKGKDKGGGKGGAENENEEEPLVELELNKDKGATHVISFQASDSFLIELYEKANSRVVENEDEEGADEPNIVIDEEAVAILKGRLGKFRDVEKAFGTGKLQAASDEESTKAEGEEGKNDASPEEADGEEKKAETEETSKQEVERPALMHEWLENKFSARILQLPCDKECADALSLALIEEGAGQDTYVGEFVEENGAIPGIAYLTANQEKPGQWGSAANAGNVETPSASTTHVDDANQGEEGDPSGKSDDAESSKDSAARAKLLPHEQTYEDVTVEEAEEIAPIIEKYKKYCSENVMKNVTLGMMKVLSDPDCEDVVDAMADYLIAEGKRLEKEGEEAARQNFEALLQHVDNLSSRLIDGRDDSTMATGTVLSSAKF